MTARWSDPHRLPVRPAGSEKAAAHRLGLSHSTAKHHLTSAQSKVGAATTAQLVWILGPQLPEPEGLLSGAPARRLCSGLKASRAWNTFFSPRGLTAPNEAD